MKQLFALVLLFSSISIFAQPADQANRGIQQVCEAAVKSGKAEATLAPKDQKLVNTCVQEGEVKMAVCASEVSIDSIRKFY